MSVTVDIIHNANVDIDSTVYNSDLVCRGCLKRSGEMKNIYEWGLDEDFFSYTEVSRNPTEEMPQLLCEGCELDLRNAKTFKHKCQQSDKILRSTLKKKNTNNIPANQTQITAILRNKKLLLLITAPNPEDKICLHCPHKLCDAEFYKKTHLMSHLRKAHNISEDFEVELQFYCTENNCVYNLTSDPKKFFTGRKYLNQHYNKIHNDKIYTCESCNKKFSKVSDHSRHLKSCNLIYVCNVCSTSYLSNESYLVHLMRKHPEQHAKYKEDKKNLKRLAVKNEEVSESLDAHQPKKIKKENTFEETGTKIVEEMKSNTFEATSFLKDTEANMTRFPPLQLDINVIESSIPPAHLIADTETVGPPYVAEEHIIQDNVDGESVPEDQTEESFAEHLTVAEDYTIGGDSADEEVITENVESIISNPIVEESLGAIGERIATEVSDGVDGNNENYSFKKSSATQIPEDITNDVSLTSWSNKHDFEFQNEMSTQTVFEDLLSMKSQHSEEEMYFSESVSLSDIQTQTAPFEFGLIRCNKETQACTSQTQSPDLSIKETQTCFCLYDTPRYNFRHFDSLSSSPASSNFISTETQTSDFRTPVRSDVLLSFSSAETQTCFEESSNGSM